MYQHAMAIDRGAQHELEELTDETYRLDIAQRAAKPIR
jgi:hypothetical protein